MQPSAADHEDGRQHTKTDKNKYKRESVNHVLAKYKLLWLHPVDEGEVEHYWCDKVRARQA